MGEPDLERRRLAQDFRPRNPSAESQLLGLKAQAVPRNVEQTDRRSRSTLDSPQLNQTSPSSDLPPR